LNNPQKMTVTLGGGLQRPSGRLPFIHG
jgi:hypothetical protein